LRGQEFGSARLESPHRAAVSHLPSRQDWNLPPGQVRSQIRPLEHLCGRTHSGRAMPPEQKIGLVVLVASRGPIWARRWVDLVRDLRRDRAR
jgi:hypothetical protein